MHVADTEDVAAPGDTTFVAAPEVEEDQDAGIEDEDVEEARPERRSRWRPSRPQRAGVQVHVAWVALEVGEAHHPSATRDTNHRFDY